jgi:hypothetical protein
MNPIGLAGFRNFERRQLLHLLGKVLDALRGSRLRMSRRGFLPHYRCQFQQIVGRA